MGFWSVKNKSSPCGTWARWQVGVWAVWAVWALWAVWLAAGCVCACVCVAGCWLLAAGCWLLAAGCVWLMAGKEFSFDQKR